MSVNKQQRRWQKSLSLSISSVCCCFPSVPVVRLGTKPRGFKAAKIAVGIDAGVDFVSIHDCLFQGGGVRQVQGTSSASAITKPHQPPGCKMLKSFLITEGRAYNSQCGIPAWEAQILRITSKLPESPHQNNCIIKAAETRAFRGGQSRSHSTTKK